MAPIAIYTSGKGSSAAGLTASVNRDPASRNFVVEGQLKFISLSFIDQYGLNSSIEKFGHDWGFRLNKKPRVGNLEHVEVEPRYSNFFKVCLRGAIG